MNGFVLVGTTTVQAQLRSRAARTAARPAFPPEEMKKWIVLSLFEGFLRDWRMKLPIPLFSLVSFVKLFGDNCFTVI